MKRTHIATFIVAVISVFVVFLFLMRGFLPVGSDEASAVSAETFLPITEE